MAIRADLKLTSDDYRLLPDGGPRYQLIDGELFMTPSPNYRHADVVVELTTRMRAHANRHRLGKVFTAPFDVYLGENDVVQPDILFIAKGHEDRGAKDGIHGAPDLVVEVLSPSTRKIDLVTKRARYAAAGVIEAWYVDLDTEEVIVYRLQENPKTPARTLGRGEALASPLLPGFEVAVDSVVDAT